jgi:hypothetical protein
MDDLEARILTLLPIDFWMGDLLMSSANSPPRREAASSPLPRRYSGKSSYKPDLAVTDGVPQFARNLLCACICRMCLYLQDVPVFAVRIWYDGAVDVGRIRYL